MNDTGRRPGLSVAAIVLAGGASRRMGRPKALVRFGGPDDRTMIEHVWDGLRSCVDEIVTVGGDLATIAVTGRHVPDAQPGAGPLAGLATGLREIRSERALLVGCDMPFIDARVVAAMLEVDDGSDIVALARPGGYEPLHAIYHRRVADSLDALLRGGERRLQSVAAVATIRLVGVEKQRAIDPNGWSTFNVNTPDDLEIARRRFYANPSGESCARLP